MMIFLEILEFIGACIFALMVICLIGKIGENDDAENVSDGKEVETMVRIENECVGCRDLGLPCMGSACQNKKVIHLYCDKCKSDVDELYDVCGDELCCDCLLECVFEYFPKITAEDIDD